MKIYLDDKREAPEGWTRCHTYEEFVNAVKKEFPEEVSFDHDLKIPHYNCDYSDGQTGYDALLFFLSYCVMNEKTLPPIHLHTASPQGKERMETLLKTLTNIHKL